MKKLIVFTTSKNSYTPSRLVEAAKKNGLEAVSAQYNELTFSVRKDYVNIAINNSVNLDDFDYFVLRAAGVGDTNYAINRIIIAKYYSQITGKKVLNSYIYSNYGNSFDKLLQSVFLAKAGLPVIDCNYYAHFDLINKDYQYPFILKTMVGSHGEGVKKINNIRDFRYQIAKLLPWKTLFQPFLKTGEDYRIIVVGDQVVGTMKRMVNGSHLTNVSAGGLTEAVKTTEELKKLALAAARVFKAEYCGVDIMYDDQRNPYILEVNAAAQLRGFQKCTNIDVADKVIKYLISS